MTRLAGIARYADGDYRRAPHLMRHEGSEFIRVYSSAEWQRRHRRVLSAREIFKTQRILRGA